MKRTLFIVFFLVSAGAHGAQVLEVQADGRTAVITQSEDTPSFRMNDYLCVIDGEIDIACGPVIEVLAREALLRFDFIREPVNSGDKVVFGGRRVIASAEDSAAARTEILYHRRRRVFAFDLSAGVLAGANYLFPFFHFQGMITPTLSVGIQPLYMLSNRTSDALGAYGGFLTVNYYASRYYQGLWLNFGLGAYFVSSPASTGRLGVGAVQGHVGYRFHLSRGLNLGLGVGGQFMERPKKNPTFGFSEFQLTGTADLGFAF